MGISDLLLKYKSNEKWLSCSFAPIIFVLIGAPCNIILKADTPFVKPKYFGEYLHFAVCRLLPCFDPSILAWLIPGKKLYFLNIGNFAIPFVKMVQASSIVSTLI